MANMRTPISKCISEGEKKVWKYLKNNLTDDYWIWMNCNLTIETKEGHESNEIDLILYHGDIGLLVLSIKDWRINQIDKITKNRVVLKSGKICGHPFENAKQHRYCIQSKLKRKEFLDDLGRPQLSVNAGVVLPYIDKSDMLNILSGEPHDYNLPTSAVLFEGDFTDNSPLSNIIHQKIKLQNMRDARYRWVTPLSNEQLECLDKLLSEPLDEEEVVSEILKNDAFTRIDNTIILILDAKQKEIADKYLKKIMQKPGHSLIKGVAGSGKTVLLQFIFAELAKIPSYRILMVVFNKALRDSTREALEELGIPMDCDNYGVETFFSLFVKQWPRKLKSFKSNDRWYDEKAMDEFIHKKLNSIKDEYDFVLIDEGQDFRDAWIKMIIAYAKEKGNVVYTEDFEQNLYSRKRTYIDAGLEVKGQGKESNSLLINYRNTKEINQFALRLSKKSNSSEYENREYELRKGTIPDVIIGDNQESKKIWEKIKEWEGIGYEPGSIAIIYPSYPRNSRNSALAGLFDIYVKNNKKLNILIPIDNKNIPYPIYDAKMYDHLPMKDEKLNKLTTLQSSKGLDFQCVVFVVDGFEQWDDEKTINGLYVGMTRARSELLLVMPEQSSYAKDALKIQKELKEESSIKSRK